MWKRYDNQGECRRGRDKCDLDGQMEVMGIGVLIQWCESMCGWDQSLIEGSLFVKMLEKCTVETPW